MEPLTIPIATPTPVFGNYPTGQPGGIIVAMTAADISHKDIHQDISVTLATRGPGISYSRLLRLRTGRDIKQPSLLIECDLCQHWEMSEPEVYRFVLRKDITWQDISPVNGRKLTTKDIVYSYMRQRTEDWPNSSLLAAIHTVEAQDDTTLKITLRFPDTDFLLALADGHTKVVAREVAEGPGGLKGGPVVGTGPWIWLDSQKDVGSVFEANPDYYEPGLPFAREIAFKVIRDPEIRVASFITGLVNVYDTKPEGWEILEANSTDYQTFQSMDGGIGTLVAVNVSRYPFDNEETRRAIFYSLNPVAYLKEVWNDIGFISAGIPIIENSWSVTGAEGVNVFDDYSVSRLAQNNDVEAFELILADYGDRYLAIGNQVAQDLKKAGFNPKLKVLTPVEYSEQVWGDRDYQMFIGPMPPTSSPNSYLFAALHSDGQWNIIGHEDELMDHLILAQQAHFYDSPERGEVLQSLQRHVLEQAYMFNVGANGTLWAFQKDIRGFYPNTAISEYSFWAKTWIQR